MHVLPPSLVLMSYRKSYSRSGTSTIRFYLMYTSLKKKSPLLQSSSRVSSCKFPNFQRSIVKRCVCIALITGSVSSYRYVGDSTGTISVLKLDKEPWNIVQMKYCIPLSASHGEKTSKILYDLP